MSPHRPALECVPFGVHALQTEADTSQAA
jgi:hypothetical protein